MKSYLFRIRDDKEEKLWIAMRLKAIKLGITVRTAFVQAIQAWVRDIK
jgi:hypothetical protein